MGISTHVLDTTSGRPAAAVPICLSRLEGEVWVPISEADLQTDADGRCRQLLPAGIVPEPGTYRIRFDTAAYYAAQHLSGLYPYVEIAFQVRNTGEDASEQHFHIPLLLTTNSYTTYRGS